MTRQVAAGLLALLSPVVIGVAVITTRNVAAVLGIVAAWVVFLGVLSRPPEGTEKGARNE